MNILTAVFCNSIHHERRRALTSLHSIHDDKLETIEALTSRFARAADILTQRVGKSIVALTREEAPTVIDRVHLLEKIDVIESAETLITIRDIRNEIEHEYTEEGIQKIFEKCMPLVPRLLAMVDSVARYADGVAHEGK